MIFLPPEIGFPIASLWTFLRRRCTEEQRNEERAGTSFYESLTQILTFIIIIYIHLYIYHVFYYYIIIDDSVYFRVLRMKRKVKLTKKETFHF